MQIATLGKTQAMSSREIAEFTKKEHGHVKRDIENMLAQLGEDASNFGSTYRDAMGRRQIEYVLNKDLTLTLVSGYSAPMRFAIIKRWQELEESQAPKLPQTYAQALRLAAEQAEQIEAQQLQLEAQKPAVEFLDRYVEAKSAKGIREVAKVLGIKERQFIEMLESNGVMFRQGGNLLPMAQYQHSGYFEVKTGESNGHAYLQTRFTPEGVAWIAKKITKMPGKKVDA
jgi:phage antirepressor YoqD-like protein